MAVDPTLPIDELRSVFGAGIDGADVIVERVYEPVASASSGIWRVRAGTQTAILKLVAHSETGHEHWRSGEDPTHWYYWRREVLAYETGLLASLPGGLRAPECRLIAPRADGSVALWLEDLRGAAGPTWPLEQYGPAARHLGQMQGAYVVGEPLPADEWLSRDWMRTYLLQRDGDMYLVDRTDVWAHPRLAPWFASPPIERVHAMRQDQSRFLAALDALPRTVCHLDLHPANLFAAADTDDVNVTVAIDWAFMGIAAIGEDAGNLVPDAVLDFHVDPEHIGDLYEIVSREYAAGLRDAGAVGLDAAARLGMAATIAAKYAWIAPAMLAAVAEDRPLLNRRPIDESLRWWAPTVPFLLARAEEARTLTQTS